MCRTVRNCTKKTAYLYPKTRKNSYKEAICTKKPILKTKPGSYEQRLENLKKHKEAFEQEEELRNLRKSMRRFKAPTTTKLILAYLFVNCTIVEIYSMVAMWRLADLSALYTLITAVVTEAVSFAVYAAKAYNETKQEELVKLEREKLAVAEGEAAG